MAEVMYSGQMGEVDLSQLFAAGQQFQPPGEALLLVEQMPRRVVSARERQDLLRFEIYRPEIDVLAYTSGRVFQQEYELRWEKLEDGLVQVVYLGTELNKKMLQDYRLKENETFFSLLESQKLQYREKRYHLFGKKLEEKGWPESTKTGSGKIFIEAGIPRILSYPVHDSPQRVQLIVREYVCQETGQIEYFRFLALQSLLEA